MRHLEDLSHDELAVLVREYLLAGQLMDRAGMPHLISAYGRDKMADIAIDEWMGASPIYSMRMQRLLDFADGDVPTIFKGMQFDIGAPPEFMDFRYKVVDAHHGEFWLDHCGALMDVEPMGDDYVTAMCHAIEDPTFDATAIATNRRAQVRPIHRPPRVTADRQPHSHWTFVIDASHPELPLPEPMGHVGRTLLASVELPPRRAGPPAAPRGGGGDDYRGPGGPGRQTEQFSTAALRALAEEICVQQHLLVTSFCFAIERRHGTEAAVSVVERQFTGIAGLTSERLRRALGLGSDPAHGPVTASLDEVATVLELHPAFRPRAYVDWQVRPDGGALTVELGDCPALHEQGFETWISRLADGHDGGLETAVQGVTPFGRVERTGPRAWSVTLAAEPAVEPSEVALTRFSTGADFTFVATPVTLAARRSRA